MCMGLAVPAFAAEMETLSQYAGKIVPVQIAEETENGWVTRFIEVAIPEGATKEEEIALTNAAVLGQGDVSTCSTNAETLYFLSETNNLVIKAQEQKVGGNKRPANVKQFDKYAISVDIKSMDSSDVELLFQIRDAAHPSYTSNWVSMDLNHRPWLLYIICLGLPTSDEGISVYAKTQPDWYVYLNYCVVQGIVT